MEQVFDYENPVPNNGARVALVELRLGRTLFSVTLATESQMDQQNLSQKLIDVSFLNNPGIYVIKCKVSDKYYIGETYNLLDRLGRHAVSLTNNTCDCKELQADFNQHGSDSISFGVIEYGSAFIKERKRKNTEERIIKNYRKRFGQDKVYNQTQNKNWVHYRRVV